MKAFKMLLVVFAIMLSTANYANPSYDDVGRKTSISQEIEQMLSDSDLVIEDDFTATVFFEVTKDKRIWIRGIESSNKEVNKFLKERLQNRKLFGDSWYPGKIYELPVRVHGTR
ncbi:MAG: hypothetical protein WBL21_08040 [Salinimicrobium sp.]